MNRPYTSTRGILSFLPSLFCAALLGALIFSTGCSVPPPSRLEIAKAIRTSEPFQQTKWMTIQTRHTGTCADALLVNQDWSHWKALGIIQTEEMVTASGKVCQVVLSEDSRREAQNLAPEPLHGDHPNEDISDLRVPVAVRNFVHTVDIRQVSADTVEVYFEWQWRPNRIGEKLINDNSVKTAWARLVNDERGWRTMSIRLAD